MYGVLVLYLPLYELSAFRMKNICLGHSFFYFCQSAVARHLPDTNFTSDRTKFAATLEKKSPPFVEAGTQNPTHSFGHEHLINISHIFPSKLDLFC